MKHQGFIDWMKASGMLLIVIGHIIGSPYHIFNMVTQPIYTKQLGVCFFIFIMGWGLANENRAGLRVVFNRLFPIYFYGIIFAIILSGIYFFTINDINESNYLPFFLGINVFFNNFPANPTTWYIGTYLHILLFWLFFMQGKEIYIRHILVALVVEVCIRCFIIYLGKDFIAYMLLPNWLTVFLLGAYLHNKKDSFWQPKTTVILFIWLIAIAFWSSPINGLSFDGSFPFRALNVDVLWTLPLRSLLISCIYLISTIVVFELFRCLPKLNIISFFARNSLITFIIHMPLIYAFSADVYHLFDSTWAGKWTLIAIIYIGLAIVSEFIQKYVNIKKYQRKTWDFTNKLYNRLFNSSRP